MIHISINSNNNTKNLSYEQKIGKQESYDFGY